VHLKQSDRNATPGKEQRQHGAARAAADDAAGSLLDADNFTLSLLCLN